MLKLIYLSGTHALIGTATGENKINERNTIFTIDKTMLCVIYYDRISNKAKNGWDYLTTYSMQPMPGTDGPQTITVPEGHVIVDCTDERMKKVYEAAISPKTE